MNFIAPAIKRFFFWKTQYGQRRGNLIKMEFLTGATQIFGMIQILMYWSWLLCTKTIHFNYGIFVINMMVLHPITAI